jgi:hypothetical protein
MSLGTVGIAVSLGFSALALLAPGVAQWVAIPFALGLLALHLTDPHGGGWRPMRRPGLRGDGDQRGDP